jgi:hypothetical protein
MTTREVGRGLIRRDREDGLDLADIGGNADAATHAGKIAPPTRTPKPLDTALAARSFIRSHRPPGRAAAVVRISQKISQS